MVWTDFYNEEFMNRLNKDYGDWWNKTHNQIMKMNINRTMKKYVKKPIVIDAIQWDGTEEMALKIAGQDDFEGRLIYDNNEFLEFRILTLEGEMRVEPRAYVIKGIKGEYYACREDIFNQTYDAHE